MTRIGLLPAGGLVLPQAANDWDKLESLNPEVELGGTWEPRNCTSRHHVAIIIPYRDRDEHLRMFLAHMHPFLQRQQLNYTIYVIEQVFHLFKRTCTCSAVAQPH